jgi:hypothetical protein
MEEENTMLRAFKIRSTESEIPATLLGARWGGGGEVLFAVPSPLSLGIPPGEVFRDFFKWCLLAVLQRCRQVLAIWKDRETFSSLPSSPCLCDL